MKMLVDIKDARQLEQMRQVVVSLQMANRAHTVGHARRLLKQAIIEAESVKL